MFEFIAIDCTILDIPGYFFFTVIGLVVSMSTFIVLLYEKKISLPQNIRILLIAFIFTFVFSKLFGCISGIYRDIGLNQKISSNSITQTGIVYYGGLFGLLVSYMACLKIIHQDVRAINVLAVCIPLFHSISRIGCFFGGCCFGKESNSFFAINYITEVLGEISTMPRIPVQLIEALFEFVVFIYLFSLIHAKQWESKNILKRYILIYSIGRFILEFYRGDLERGIIHGISFSQVICVLIWVYLILQITRQHSNKLKEKINLWS